MTANFCFQLELITGIAYINLSRLIFRLIAIVSRFRLLRNLKVKILNHFSLGIVPSVSVIIV